MNKRHLLVIDDYRENSEVVRHLKRALLQLVGKAPLHPGNHSFSKYGKHYKKRHFHR
ncbi:hypothetical protein [Paenibacillus sp. Root444D2]|uniref:hypothetical protein n=1 Tax=Paenibacillus sp. Root444D2 TaxID=1736538 RepID=UPI0012E35F3B|nr:hypothetical protein [Paenibacillus sp. Root444D2]